MTPFENYDSLRAVTVIDHNINSFLKNYFMGPST